MAKLVYLSLPAHGHLNPVLPLIRELVQRFGHDVLVYSTPEFELRITQCGGQFRAYPANPLTAVGLSQAVRDGNMANMSRLLLEASESLIPFAVGEIRREAPRAVVFDATAVWAAVACRVLAVRSVATIPFLILQDSDLVRRRPRALLKALGFVPALPGIVRSRRRLMKAYGSAMPAKLFPALGELNIAFTSSTLQPRSPQIDESFRFVGPSIDRQRDQIEFPFAQLDGRPVVYISLGTIHDQAYDFYRKCFEAFGDHPGQFVLSVGTTTDQTRLASVPRNFIVRSHVPQLQILERCAVFVSHGGVNSIHEALYSGVPLVLVPQQFEQLCNAVIVEERGAGLVIDGPALRGKLRASELRDSVQRLLGDGAFRSKAGELQRELRATGGTAEAADAIDAFIQRH